MMTGNEDPPITADQVLQFLSENPDVLHRLTGKNLAIDAADGKIVDLTPAIAKRARNEARRMGQQNQSIFKLAAENMVNWQRLHHAALALLAAGDAQHLFHVVAAQFPPIFDLSSSHLITASPALHGMACKQEATLCTPEELQTITSGKSLSLGQPSKNLCKVLNITPASVAIISLPDRLAEPVANSVLVLCGHAKSSFTPDLANDLLVLLAELVGVALTAQLEKHGWSGRL